MTNFLYCGNFKDAIEKMRKEEKFYNRRKCLSQKVSPL